MKLWKSFSVLMVLVLVAGLGMVVLASPVKATTCSDEVWVATNGNDANLGTQAKPFATIQKGVDTVCPGGTVHVGPGTYNENVVISTEGILLQSTAGAEATIIDAHITIPFHDAGIDGGGSGITIQGGLMDSQPTGFVDGGADNVIVDGFTVKNATFEGLIEPEEPSLVLIVVVHGAGIALVNVSEVVVRNCIVMANNVGIVIIGLELFSHNTIMDNTITNNDVGISVGDDENVIADNIITNNGHGIVIGGAVLDATVHGIQIGSGNAGIIPHMTANNNLIIGNTIAHNKAVDSGVHNGTYAVGNVINFNNIEDNEPCNVYNAPGNNTLDATNNYLANPNGAGDENTCGDVNDEPHLGARISEGEYLCENAETGTIHFADVDVEAEVTVVGRCPYMCVYIPRYEGNPHGPNPQGYESVQYFGVHQALVNQLDFTQNQYDYDHQLCEVQFPIRVTKHYTDEEIRAIGCDERTLTLFRWNGQQWVELTDVQVNSGAHTVTGLSSEFGDFVLKCRERLPEIVAAKRSSPCADIPGCPLCFTPPLIIEPQQVAAGQPVTIAVRASNNCDGTSKEVVSIRINGTVEQSRTVEVGPHTVAPVRFTVTKSQPGTYTVNIGEQKGSFTVIGSSGSTAGSPPSRNLVVILIIGVLVVATVVVLMITFRRPA
jgi:parallel beta-helix repeat protein